MSARHCRPSLASTIVQQAASSKPSRHFPPGRVPTDKISVIFFLPLVWKKLFLCFLHHWTYPPVIDHRFESRKKLFMFHLNMYGINIYYFPSFPFTILHVFPFCLCKNLFLLFFRWVLCRSVRLRLIYRGCRFLWLRTRTQHISWIATNSCLHMVTEPEHTLLNPFLYLTSCRPGPDELWKSSFIKFYVEIRL